MPSGGIVSRAQGRYLQVLALRVDVRRHFQRDLRERLARRDGQLHGLWAVSFVDHAGNLAVAKSARPETYALRVGSWNIRLARLPGALSWSSSDPERKAAKVLQLHYCYRYWKDLLFAHWLGDKARVMPCCRSERCHREPDAHSER